MDLGWKVLIPISLAWILIVAAMQVNRYMGFGLLVLSLLCAVLLFRSMSIGDQSGEAADITLAPTNRPLESEARQIAPGLKVVRPTFRSGTPESGGSK